VLVKDVIPNDIHYNQLRDLIPDSSTIDLGSWKLAIFLLLFSISGGPNGAIIFSMYP
jgi:hypothetical protein